MIVGIGTDIIEISRVKKAAEQKRFLERCFTAEENKLLRKKSAQSVAGGFAAKEAVAKALGTGFRGFGPADIEVLSDEYGKPFVRLHGGALTAAGAVRADRILVSISHCGEYAAAFAVAERCANER